MAREHQEQRETPKHEPESAATVERGQEREEREQAREQEQAVHPPVDPLEHEYPAPRGERGGGEPDGSVGEPRTEECDQRDARDREDQ